MGEELTTLELLNYLNNKGGLGHEVHAALKLCIKREEENPARTFNTDLRENVKCTVTGFNGYVTARCESIGDGKEYLIERVDKDGGLQQVWIHEDRLISN